MTNIRFTQIILFFTPPLLEAKAANTSRRGLSLRAVGGAEADGRSDQEKPKKKRNIEDARLSRDYFVTVLHRQEQTKWAATKPVIVVKQFQRRHGRPDLHRLVAAIRRDEVPVGSV